MRSCVNVIFLMEDERIVKKPEIILIEKECYNLMVLKLGLYG